MCNKRKGFLIICLGERISQKLFLFFPLPPPHPCGAYGGTKQCTLPSLGAVKYIHRCLENAISC